MIQIRKTVIFARRVRNKISSWINLLNMFFLDVQHGKNCCVHGYLPFILKPSSQIVIGDNFYYSSGNNINSLSANVRGCIAAEEEARIIIGDNVGMSSTILRCHKSITIGNHVKFGARCVVLDSDAHSMDYMERRDFWLDSQNKKSKAVVIEDDVLIGMNCIILKGVTIGARSVIGAGSIVTKSVPADCIAAGVPAKVFKKNELR